MKHAPFSTAQDMVPGSHSLWPPTFPSKGLSGWAGHRVGSLLQYPASDSAWQGFPSLRLPHHRRLHVQMFLGIGRQWSLAVWRPIWVRCRSQRSHGESGLGTEWVLLGVGLG